MVKLTKTMIKKMTPKESTRTFLPVDDWHQELMSDGAVSIDIYTTSKKNENPNGLKFSSVRVAMVDPKLNILDPKHREIVATDFKNAYYAIYKDESGNRKLLVVASDQLVKFTDFDFTFLPLSQPLRKSPQKKVKKTTFADVEEATPSDPVAASEDMETSK